MGEDTLPPVKWHPRACLCTALTPYRPPPQAHCHPSSGFGCGRPPDQSAPPSLVLPCIYTALTPFRHPPQVHRRPVVLVEAGPPVKEPSKKGTAAAAPPSPEKQKPSSVRDTTPSGPSPAVGPPPQQQQREKGLPPWSGVELVLDQVGLFGGGLLENQHLGVCVGSLPHVVGFTCTASVPLDVPLALPCLWHRPWTR